MEQPRHVRLALVYYLWATAVIVALFFARAYHLDSFNVGWGDQAADHRHAVLGWQTLAAVAVCLALTAMIGVVSRLAISSVITASAIAWSLALLGAHGPHNYRVVLFIPQLPGFFAAIMALGVHGDERLTALWTTSVNSILYAPLIYAIAHHKLHVPNRNV